MGNYDDSADSLKTGTPSLKPKQSRVLVVLGGAGFRPPDGQVAANSLSDDLDVLCFDEFQITDIQVAIFAPAPRAIRTPPFCLAFTRGRVGIF